MPYVPSIPESAPFNSRQRLWLNGYLAGLFSFEEGQSMAVPQETSARATVSLLILFGSQTGTAEGLARRIAKEAEKNDCTARVMDAAAHAKIDWKNETNFLIVTSTYGDGDMPDNAQSFWDWLQTEAAGALSHLNFSVLALGDSSYLHFCAAGQKIDLRLEQLGAKRVYPRVDCDVDYEAAAKEWMEGVLVALGNPDKGSTALQKNQSLLTSAPTGEEGFSRANPFAAQLVLNRRLNGEASGKETRHFEISLEESGLRYEVGDALGVYPSNCPALVEDILRVLECDGEEAVTAPGGPETSLRKALTCECDITKPGPDLLRRLAESNVALRDLLAPGREADLKKSLWGREVIDLLAGAILPPVEFVRLLKKLAPRLYSISSSPKVHANRVHLTVNIVRHQAHGRARKGVCSTFLADRAGERAPVPVFVQKSHGFRLPMNADTPMIMVGPGTGVAPFRAFLHERLAMGAKGRNWLFFGEQRMAQDFYYREEFEQMLAAGHLVKLSTAFSRDQREKVYVQHRMMEEAAELWSWLKDGAHFYVCGDASRMAKDVDMALHKVIETGGGLTSEQAVEFVRALKNEKRYQRDVY